MRKSATVFFVVSLIIQLFSMPFGANAAPKIKLQPPAGVKAVYTSPNVTLTWNEADQAVSYSVYRSDSKGNHRSLIARTADLSYVDPVGIEDYSSDRNFEYELVSVDASGQTSDYAKAVSVKIPRNIPAAPDSLSIRWDQSSPRLTWKTKDPLAAGFLVYRSFDRKDAYQLISEEPIMGTTYVDQGLSGFFFDKPTTVYYAVAAVSSSGIESPKEEEKWTIPESAGPSPVKASINGHQVQVTWPAIWNATKYRIYEYNDKSKKNVLIAEVKGDATTYADPIPEENRDKTVKWTYSVAAVDSRNGETGRNDSTSVTLPVTSPSVPKSLHIEYDGQTLSIRWSSAVNADKYRIYRATGSPNRFTAIGEAPAGETRYVDSAFGDLNAAPGTKLYYAVSAVNRYGAESDKKIASTEKKAPAKPARLSAVLSQGIVILQWDAAAGAVSYRVCKEGAAASACSVTSENRFAESYRSTNYSRDTKVQYSVVSLDKFGYPSTSVRTGKIVIPPAIVYTPESFTVTASGRTNELRWSVVPNAQTYRVYRSVGQSGKMQPVAEAGPSATRYVDTDFAKSNIQEDITVKYRVAAVNRYGVESDPTPVQTILLASYKGPALIEGQTSESGVRLIWTPVKDASSYSLYRASQPEGPYVKSASSLTSNVYEEQLLETLTEDRVSYFRITAVDGEGRESLPSDTVAITQAANVPSIPAGLLAVADGTKVTLTWEPSSHAAGYRILRSDSPEGPFASLTSELVQDPVFMQLITDIDAETHYAYAVAAVNRFGTESPMSSAAIVTITPPLAPQNVRAVLSGENAMITWSAVDPEAGERFRIYRSESPTEGYVLLSEGQFQDNAYADPAGARTFEQDTSYYYRVSAVDRNGVASRLSEPVSISFAKNVPETPTNVEAYAAEDHAVTVTWNESPNAAGYRIYRTHQGIESLVSGPNPVEGHTFIDTEMQGIFVDSETTYSYRVAAVNRYGAASAHSLGVSVTFVPVAPPDGLQVQLESGTVRITWQAAASATGYRIYRQTEPGAAFEAVHTVLADQLSFEDAYGARTLPEQLNLKYRIVSLDGLGYESQPSASAEIVLPANVADVPESAAGTRILKQVSLEWETSANAVTYRIYRSVGNDTFMPLADAAVPAFSDDSFLETVFAADTTVRYRVTAVNAYGSESEPSSDIVITFAKSIAAPKLQADLSEDAILLQWQPVQGAIGYILSRQSGEEQTVQIAEITEGTAYEDLAGRKTRQQEESYRYTIVAYDKEGIPSPTSTPVTVTLPANMADAPSAITAQVTQNKINLQWATSSAAISYKIYRASSEAGPYSLVMTTNVTEWTDTSYSNADLTQETTVYYQITSQNKYGTASAASSVVSAKLTPIASVLTGTELLANGEFTIAGSGGIAKEWNSYVSTGLNAVFNVANSEQTLSSAGMSSGSVVMLYQDVNVQPNSSFQVSGQFAAPTLTSARAELYVEFFDGANRSQGIFKSLLTDRTSDYVQLSAAGIVPSGALYARVSANLRALAGNAQGTLKVDRISFAINPNLISNGGFENSGSNGDVADGWSIRGSTGSSVSANVVSTPVAQGAKAQRLKAEQLSAGSTAMIYRPTLIAVKSSETYTYSGQLLVQELTQAQAELYVEYYDAQSKLIASDKSIQNAVTSGYVRISKTLVPPAAAVNVRLFVLIRSTGASGGGTLFADDMELVVNANKITNAGFEASADGSLADGWKKYVSVGAQMNLAIVTSPTATGSYAQRIEASQIPNTGTAIVFQEFPVQSNRVYAGSGKLAVEKLNQARAEVRVQFFDAAGASVGTNFAQLTQPTAGFQTLHVTGIAPADAVTARLHAIIRATGSGGSGVIYADDFSFTSDANRIPNGGFELVTADGQPDQWIKYVSTGTIAEFGTMPSPDNPSNAVAKITANNMKSGGAALLFQTIPIAGDRSFSFSGKVSAVELTNARAEVYMEYIDSAGKIISSVLLTQNTPSNGFVKVEKKGVTPVQTVSVKVYVILRAQQNSAGGTVYFDDVRLEAL